MKTFFLVLSVACATSATYAANPVLLKTGPEIFASYARVTGISGNDPDLQLLYRQDVKRLPQQGAPAELSNNVILAATELGGAFCQKAILKEISLPSGQRQLFNSVDFTRGPSQFDDSTQGLLFEDLAVAFWQKDVSDDEKAAMKKALLSATKNNPDSSDQTAKSIQVICSIYASSLAFLVK